MCQIEVGGWIVHSGAVRMKLFCRLVVQWYSGIYAVTANAKRTRVLQRVSLAYHDNALSSDIGIWLAYIRMAVHLT